MLKLTDTELGLDPEYSRQGVLAMLEQFNEALGTSVGGKFKFKWT